MLISRQADTLTSGQADCKHADPQMCRHTYLYKVTLPCRKLLTTRPPYLQSEVVVVILLYSVLNLNYTLKLYRACWQMSSWQVVLYFFLVTKSTYQEQPVRIILDNTLAYMVLQQER